MPIDPLSTVGMMSFPIFAITTPQRPSWSKSLYRSKEVVVNSAVEKFGTLLLIVTYAFPLYAGILDRSKTYSGSTWTSSSNSTLPVPLSDCIGYSIAGSQASTIPKVCPIPRPENSVVIINNKIKNLFFILLLLSLTIFRPKIPLISSNFVRLNNQKISLPSTRCISSILPKK